VWKPDASSTVFAVVLVASQIGSPGTYPAGPPSVRPCLHLMLNLINEVKIDRILVIRKLNFRRHDVKR